MNSLLTLTLLCLLSVGQVVGQFQSTAGETSLQGSVTGGASTADPKPTRWIEFMDMDNDWSKLGTTYTVEAWIWHSNTGSSSWQPVLARHPGSGAPRQQAQFSIAVKDNSNLEVIAGCGCDANGANCGNGYSLLATGSSFSTQTWQHVAVSFNGDGTTANSTASLYLEGDLIATSAWAASDSRCVNRAGQWARYADVTVGYLDDSATTTFGWTGRIDEIRFWQGVRTGSQIKAYHDVALNGHEDGLFAYYQFSPSNAVLQDPTAPKQITNKVGNWLHGLPQPDPTDVSIFYQSSTLHINSYTTVEGQSGLDSDLPPIPNTIHFHSWPVSNTTTFSVDVVQPYSPELQKLVSSGVARIYGNPQDLTTLTAFVTCPNNDCSTYTSNWKQYYVQYAASNGNTTTPTALAYLRIVTGCPSGMFDSCGTCEGDNSQCQCVVYHGFETQRMSFILFEWSLDKLIEDIEQGQDVLESTLALLNSTTAPDAVLRQQIYELMTFYNGDLTTYCGDLSSFMTELEAAIPRPPEALIDDSSEFENDAVMPYVPAFAPPPSSV